MDINFKNPSLDLFFEINKAIAAEDTDAVVRHAQKSRSKALYTSLVNRGAIKKNADIIEGIESAREELIGQIEARKSEDPDNENYLHELNLEITDVYAESMDIPEFNRMVEKILEYESTTAIKMDAALCRIRMAIILGDRDELVKAVRAADKISSELVDWDRKNRYNVYIGVYDMMRGEFRIAADKIADSLVSFTAVELVPFEQLVVYFIFSSFLTFTRKEMKKHILENNEVLRSGVEIGVVRCYYNSDYQDYLKSIESFLGQIKDDPLISQYEEYFRREAKLKGYEQLVSSYRTIGIKRMAEIFDMKESVLEEEMRAFISKGCLHCSIDRVNGVIEMIEKEDLNRTRGIVHEGSIVLKHINKKVS